MKKRLLSALLALALVFVLLPTTALAEVTTGDDYDISINGKGWKFEKDTTSGAYIPVYYYHTGVFDNANNQNRTNDNLELTKKDNTVTITIRRGTSHDHGNNNPINFTLKKESTNTNHDQMPCIEMGNSNNLVITGNGTLNIIRNEKDGIGAAVSSSVGDITITGGIVVSVTFKNQKNRNVSGNAISVDGHNLIISGQGTNVEAENACGNQITPSGVATVRVKNGEINVSGGAILKATNTYDDSKKPYDISYSRAISSTTLTIADENSSVIAWAYDGKYGKPLDVETYNITGATVKAGSNNYNSTETTIDKIDGKEYVKISVPALETTADVLIAKENAVVGVRTSLGEGNGYYTYNKDTKTLTLNNVNITSGINAIQFTAAGTYTVKLEGTNKISNVSTGISAESANPNFTGNINVIISGSDSLDISAKGRAIEVPKGKLTFNNTGTINLKTTNTADDKINAIKVSGDISVGSDFNKNLKITAGNDTFDLKYSNFNDLNKYKSISFSLKDSTISYGNKTLKQGEIIKDGKGGTATVDSKNNTITLNNFKGDKALVFNAEFTPNSITLIGDSTLSAVETKYQDLTISVSGSGSGSLTAGSIRVTNNDNISADLTINGGAHVTVNRPGNEDARAIDIKGNLTVTSGSLTATSTSTKPTVQVGGNASFTGSTVTITNNSTALHQDATEATKGDSVSSALYVKGNINITDNANVTAKVENGGGNAIGALGNITVNGSNVTAANRGQKFTTIIAKNVYVSGDSKITANNLNKNPHYNGWYLACPAIEGNIVNKNTDYSLNFKGEHSSSSEPKTTLAPGEQTTLFYYKVIITRGDEVARTESPVVIAGTTLLNDTYYTITNGSKVAEGTDSSNYNAFYDSETKTLKLNNAKISTTTKNAAIKISEDLTITVTGTNELKGNYNHCIESYSSFIINGDGRLEMTNGSNTSASVIYCGPDKSLTIGAEVIFKNNANSGVLLGMVEENAYSFASGYNVYASTDVSGSPLETYDAAKGSTYKYLRVTKENLAPTTPTTYTVTITGENISKYYSSEGELEQTVTAGKAIKTVTVAANGGYYFPDNYVKDLELPSGITATVSGDNWYLTIKGIPSKDATINLPVLSKRPTITVDIPLPVAGNKPATIDQIHLTCDDPNYTPEITGIRWNKGSLTEESVAIGANDTFVAGTCYNVKIFLSSGIADGAYKLAYAGGGDNPWYAYWGTSNFQLYFQATPAATHTHEKGDLQFNSEGHWYKCAADTSCTERIDFASHTYKDNICTVCNYVKPACSHTNLKYIDNNDYETHKVQCADCEEIIAEKEAHDIQGYDIDDAAGTHQEICNKCHYRGLALQHSIIYISKDNGHCKACAICKVQLGRVEEHTFENGVCTVCNATSGEIVPPTPDNPGTIVIIRPAEEEKPAQQPNPSTGANDLVGLAVAAAVAAALGSAALLRKHD